MKKVQQHIFVTLIAIIFLSASCSRDEAEVIPRNKMARIYAEMLVTDQWIMSTPSIRRIADTSLVYEPILEKYGYNSDDYRRSVEKYMDDPERFSRIFKASVEILDSKLRELEKEQERIRALANLPKIKYEYKFEELVPCMADESYTHYYDSVAVVRDSAELSYRILSIERSDTIYEGLRMIIRNLDSLKVDSMNVELFDKKTLEPEGNDIKSLDTVLFDKKSKKDLSEDVIKPVLMERIR